MQSPESLQSESLPTTQARAPRLPNAHPGDLLRVQTGTTVVPAHPEAMLERMGFRVAQPRDDHWIVTGIDPLPELHFYSITELGRFALNQAEHYQQWLDWRQHHDNTADLSG